MTSSRDFGRIVYLSAFFLVFLEGHFFVNQPYIVPNFVLFSSPLKFFPMGVGLNFFFFVGTLALLLASTFFEKKWIRFLSAVFFLILISLKFSLGKINHSHHIWFWVMPIFACFDSRKTKVWNQRIVQILQTVYLSFLFSAGLWKLRSLDFRSIGASPLEHFSYAILEGNGPPPEMQMYFLTETPWVLILGFYIVLLFQLTCILPVIFDLPMKLWGFGAIVFHTLTGVFLGIWFKPFVMFVMLFFLAWDDKEFEID